ncbi:cyclopropane-fatty-acyl-phospholipid synthase family protein [Brachybacterium sp. ACRRE]|uniref:SAM-dependent methyltransferase n=1 Tax=Brachybacterium sp. ACRRE TaxID=2918184 RepID=UPI001EF35EEA|nr:class I SAM-dependent methyltransferase [Brachybacterium sp. ACRRE]MCG7309868.1 class I SAM-dependent methyltransferase [Brachybacterium sp. ACRRE]
MDADHSTESERFWEAHYAERGAPTNAPSPSPMLVDLIGEFARQPGAALELGAGQGGDALWLARGGWTVTAADASTTAARRIEETARAEGLTDRVSAVQADLARDIPEGSFDLVFACHFQSPVEIDRDAIIARASRQVAPDGLLLVIDHASVAPWSWDQDMEFPSPEQTLEAFALTGGWDRLIVEPRRRTATAPDGASTAEVTDNVIVLRRGL